MISVLNPGRQNSSHSLKDCRTISVITKSHEIQKQIQSLETNTEISIPRTS